MLTQAITVHAVSARSTATIRTDVRAMPLRDTSRVVCCTVVRVLLHYLSSTVFFHDVIVLDLTLPFSQAIESRFLLSFSV